MEVLAEFIRVELIWAAVISVIVPALLAAVWRKLVKADIERKTQKAALLSMLRQQIVDAYNKYYEDKGFLPIYAREAIEDMFVQYAELGGNGVIAGLHDKLMALPTTRKYNRRKEDQ